MNSAKEKDAHRQCLRAAPSATGPLIPTTIQRRDLGPHDLLIGIVYVGICHSDIHTVRGHWGPIAYSQVVGHEIEVTPASAINEAYECAHASDVRYRFVIDNSTLSRDQTGA